MMVARVLSYALQRKIMLEAVAAAAKRYMREIESGDASDWEAGPKHMSDDVAAAEAALLVATKDLSALEEGRS